MVLDPAELEDWLQLALSALSVVVFVVSALAYGRRRTTRTLFIMVAFGLYMVSSLFLVADFVLAEDAVDVLESVAIFFEAGFVALIVLAFFRD